MSTPAPSSAVSHVLLMRETGSGLRVSSNINSGSASVFVGTIAILSLMAVTGHMGESGMTGRVTTFFCPAFCMFLPHLMTRRADVGPTLKSFLVGCRCLSNVFSDIGAISDWRRAPK